MIYIKENYQGRSVCPELEVGPGDGSLVFMPITNSRSLGRLTWLQLLPGENMIPMPRKLLPTSDTTNDLSYG